MNPQTSRAALHVQDTTGTSFIPDTFIILVFYTEKGTCTGAKMFSILETFWTGKIEVVVQVSAC